MNHDPFTFERFAGGVLFLLTILLSGALVQAQAYKHTPEITDVDINHQDYPSRAMLVWTPHPKAVRYEVYIRGFGDAWAPAKKGGKAGWYPAEAIRWHRFFDLMPGNKYNFRIRAYNAEGVATDNSEIFRTRLGPCWAWARLLATGEYWTEANTDDPVTPPPEWAHVKNTINCE